MIFIITILLVLFMATMQHFAMDMLTKPEKKQLDYTKRWDDSAYVDMIHSTQKRELDIFGESRTECNCVKHQKQRQDLERLKSRERHMDMLIDNERRRLQAYYAPKKTVARYHTNEGTYDIDVWEYEHIILSGDANADLPPGWTYKGWSHAYDRPQGRNP